MAADKNKVMQKVQQLMSRGRWDEALDEMKELHSRDRSDPMVTLRLGDLYLKADRPKDAAQSYQRTAELFADAGHAAKAIATYKMILRIDPSYGDVEERIEKLAMEKTASLRPRAASPRPAEKKTDVIELSDAPATDAQVVQGTYDDMTPAAGEEPQGGLDRFGRPDPETLDEGLVGGQGMDAGSSYSGDDITHLLEQGYASEREPGVSEAGPAEQEPSAGQPIPLFSGMPGEELRALLGGMKRTSYNDGDTIVSEGEQGDSLYIIKSGGARVMTRVKDLNIVIAELGERDFFGEVSFLTGRPRTAEIMAYGPTEVLELAGRDLAGVIERYPDVGGVLRMFHENRVGDTVSTIKAVSKELFL